MNSRSTESSDGNSDNGLIVTIATISNATLPTVRFTHEHSCDSAPSGKGLKYGRQGGGEERRRKLALASDGEAMLGG